MPGGAQLRVAPQPQAIAHRGVEATGRGAAGPGGGTGIGTDDAAAAAHLKHISGTSVFGVADVVGRQATGDAVAGSNPSPVQAGVEGDASRGLIGASAAQVVGAQEVVAQRKTGRINLRHRPFAEHVDAAEQLRTTQAGHPRPDKAEIDAAAAVPTLGPAIQGRQILPPGKGDRNHAAQPRHLLQRIEARPGGVAGAIDDGLALLLAADDPAGPPLGRHQGGNDRVAGRQNADGQRDRSQGAGIAGGDRRIPRQLDRRGLLPFELVVQQLVFAPAEQLRQVGITWKWAGVSRHRIRMGGGTVTADGRKRNQRRTRQAARGRQCTPCPWQVVRIPPATHTPRAIGAPPASNATSSGMAPGTVLLPAASSSSSGFQRPRPAASYHSRLISAGRGAS